VRRWEGGHRPRRVQPSGRPCGAPCGLDAAGAICEEGLGRESALDNTRCQAGKLNLIFLLFGPTFGVHLRPRPPLQLIVNALLYIAKVGCHWHLLPKSFLPHKIVFHVFRAWTRNGTLGGHP
jgi:transposase